MACSQPAELPGPSGREEPPATVLQALCRPTLQVDDQSRRSGTAFLLRTGEPRPTLVLVMAQHLAGMANTPGDIPWAQMPTRARAASCQPFEGDQPWRTGPAFAIAGAHAMGPLASLKDIAIFLVLASTDEAGLFNRSLRLSSGPPAVGQTVWLVARTADRSHAGQLFHPATVLATTGFLAYRYFDADLDLSNTSGAPIVDRSGFVVGVNVAVAHQDNTLIGIADDLNTTERALADTKR